MNYGELTVQKLVIKDGWSKGLDLHNWEPFCTG